jgi:hypothetical protein
MANKKLELTGQSFKTVREHYGMSEYEFSRNIEPIRDKLDKMIGANGKRYKNLTPSQVRLIIQHLEGVQS